MTTNYDNIQSLNRDELADFIWKWRFLMCDIDNKNCVKTPCKACIRQWVDAEAEGGSSNLPSIEPVSNEMDTRQ